MPASSHRNTHIGNKCLLIKPEKPKERIQKRWKGQRKLSHNKFSNRYTSVFFSFLIKNTKQPKETATAYATH